MDYQFFDEAFTSDIGFTATGDTAEEMTIAATEATMKVMVDNLDDIAGIETKQIKLEAESLEMALFDLLGELIFYKDADELLLRVERVILANTGDHVALTAEARGEKINRQKHKLIVDVKAVTMHRFKVEQTSTGWTATVVLDI
jgi:SHS2 domain-containing protein